jgi:hypothetical protein
MKMRGSADPRRQYFIEKYKLSKKKRSGGNLPRELLDQLSRCKSAAAQRIILGVSK